MPRTRRDRPRTRKRRTATARGPWAALVLVGIALGALIEGAVPAAMAPPHAAPRDPGPEPAVAGGNSLGPTPTPDASTAEWFNATAGPQPSPRVGAAMGYDEGLGGALLVDGTQYGGAHRLLNDTWEYVDGLWTNLTPSAGPPPPATAAASLTYDLTDGYMILIGGTDGQSHFREDVWAFRDSRWTQISRLPMELQNQTVSAVYDSSDGYVLVVGCSLLPGFSPVFSWTGVSWSDRTTASSPSDCTGTLIDDPALHGVLLFGGHAAYVRPVSTTWLYSAGNWTNVTTQLGNLPGQGDVNAVQSGVGCYDAENGQALLVLGGYASPAAALTYALSANSSALNSGWSNISAPPRPASILGPGFAYDAPNGECVLEDGIASSTWALNAEPFISGLSASATPDPVDPNVTLALQATWTGGIPPFQYSWEFGDGSPTSANGSHEYVTVGSYVVNLTLEDVDNHSARASVTVEVESYPVTPAYAVPNPTDVGTVTGFYPGSTGATGVLYGSWSFGDGAGSGLPTTSHTYSVPGNFTVTATLYDNRGRWLNETFVEDVHPRLAVTILADLAAPARNQTVTFLADVYGGTAPFEYRWSFGDGSVGTGARNATHTYTSGGPFTLTVNVSDALGALANASRWIVLVLNVTISANWSLGGLGLDVGFTTVVRGGVPAYSYRWNFGDGGTDGSADPSHTYESWGNFTARLIVTDSNGSLAAATWPVTVSGGTGPLRASIVAYPPIVPPEGSTFLSAWAEGGTGGYEIDWATPGLNCVASGLLNQTCSSNGPGTYAVSVIVTDEGGSSVNDTVAVVFEAPTIPVGPSAPEPPASLSPTVRSWEIGAFVVATLLFGTFLVLSILSAIGVVTGRRPPRRGPPPRTTDGLEFPELPEE